MADHLIGTGEMAALFGSAFGAGPAARLAGLLHDLGKYSNEFQALLMGKLQRVDHSTAGAREVRALLQNSGNGWDCLVADIVSYSIAGHHAGLPDHHGLQDRLNGPIPAIDRVWRDELPVDLQNLKPTLKAHKVHGAFQLGFLGRMIFSCLVDADFKDTERFYDAAGDIVGAREWPPLPTLVDALIARFNSAIAKKQAAAAPTKVNQLRREILEHVRANASLPPGLFTLTVPTGGGKTLASLGFALDHAKAHGLRRIIYAIPFTSVIEQTAGIFRKVLGDDVVLEHHSAIDETALSQRQRREKLKLAMEDWAAPVVVTTNVQLFESLFANRPSHCRKLHNIAGSVIVLDEAQTLPLSLLKPCVAAIGELARNYGASIILCTATQPALDIGHFAPDSGMGLELAGRELAPDPAALARRLRRVTLKQAGELDDDALAAALRDTAQGLVIVNSRKHALALYQRIVQEGLDGAIHLSTRQHAVHRRRLLEEIHARLRDGLPCRVISTSLIEAGVDVDFPRVWRAEAGLDQIAQAAGRCNREGIHPPDHGIVTLFEAPDNKPPREIKQLSAAFGRMMHVHEDLLSPAAMEAYFAEVYWQKGAAIDAKAIMSRFAVDRGGTAFDYQTVADDFRMIDSGMAPVIVAEEADAKAALALLGLKDTKAGTVARKLQGYIVQVPPKARALLLSNGHAAIEREADYGDQFVVLKNGALYRQDTGLLWEDADYLDLENLMI